MFSTVINRFGRGNTNRVVNRQFKSSPKSQNNVLDGKCNENSLRHSFTFFFLLFSLLTADSSNSLNKYYHKSSLVLAVLTPAAFLVPSSVVQPIDVTLGLLFPFHAHVAMNYVISDYVPKGSRPLARGLLLAASLVGTAGLLKLNLTGPGLTSTIKALWKGKSNDKKN